MKRALSYIFIFSACILFSCASREEPCRKCLDVKATAYNSVPAQTRPGTPGNITAWGDTLYDTIPSIAVSRDLLDSGLVYGTRVKIQGYTTPFRVNDKMNRRFKNRIDIHFGKDVERARKFGVKELKICWNLPDSSLVVSQN